MASTRNSAVSTRNIYMEVGYINVCQPFDLTLPAESIGSSFSALGNPTTITFASSLVAEFVESQILVAQEYELEEVSHAMTVTPFVITLDNGDTYEFNPSALVSRVGNVITIDQAGVTSWAGANANADIESISFSMFSGCECVLVELVQEVEEDGNVILLSIVSPSQTDTTTLIKPEVPFPLEFGTLGPFAGPCEVVEQVLDIDDLCCNDDLITSLPDVVAEKVVWLDATETGLMLDDIGGTVIPGIDGDLVGQIDDKVNPGVGPSFLVETAGLTARPTLRLDSVNGLPTLEFDGATGINGDRIGIDTGFPLGQPIVGFFLLLTSGAPEHGSLVSVGNTGSRGIAYDVFPNTWQISRGAGISQDSLVFRYSGQTSDLQMFDWNTFADNQLHLITYQYDGTNVNLWVDGQQLVTNFAPGVLLHAGYFRIFGNRANNTFVAGNLAEYLITTNNITNTEIAAVNAYLVCKWGIDPSLAAGGVGDLTLAPPGSYSSPTPFIRLRQFDGSFVFVNTNNGQEFILPPVPGLSICAPDGEQSNVSSGYYVMQGIDSWTLPQSQYHSVSLSVVSEGAPGSITLDTNVGVRDLFPGQSLTFGVHGEDGPLQQPLVITTTHANDVLAINWVE